MTRGRCRINSLILAGTCSVRRRGNSHAQKRNDRALLRDKEARVSGETVRKVRTHHYRASEHRRIPPRPTRKARMFVGTSRASTHAETHLLSCSQTRSWVELGVQANSCNICVFLPTLMWVVREPYEGQPCWPWVTAWQNATQNPDRTALRWALSNC